ncbi:PKD domain-containing protein [Acidobacteria bacterium ACD]|nr:MAG: PKD domain-containing protein [Acidobacteriota bacterium]MDL1948400.1 PKD domain-containing protein [Acidobacteria bacterium ACD]
MVKIFVRLRAPLVTGVTAFAIAAGAALWAPPAAGQCTLQGTPNFFDPPAVTGWPMNGFESRSDDLDLYQNGAGRRLAVRATYGYVIYDLSSPDRPVQLDFHDIHAVPGYERHGDGQSTVNAIGAAPDGSRMLVAYNDLHGTLVMTPNNNRFTFAGEFTPTWTSFGGGLAVDKLPSGRIMAYSLPRSGLHVADITNPVTGAAATQTDSIPRELVDSSIAPTGIMHSLQAVEAGGKHYLVYGAGARIVLIDVTNPGPTVGSYASGFRSRVFTADEFGFPAGTSLNTVSAAEHPLTGSLHLFVEGSVGTGPETLGVVLARASVDTGLSLVGKYVPPAPFSGSTARAFGTSKLLATDDDLIAFFWEKDASSRLKLFALAASDWTTDLASTVILDPSSGQWEKAQAMTGYRQGSSVYLYVGNYSKAWAMQLSCVNSASPASANLVVQRDPCPGGTTTCPLSDGEAVFLGEKLKITTTVSPNPAQQPLTDWRFDYDFHDGNPADSNTSYPRLKVPDLSQSAGNAPPATISLVGPCDPQGSSGVDPSTGTNCWASVFGNANFGGPDYITQPGVADEGTSKTLAFALEVQNAVNAAGTSGLKRFNVAWKVPRVKLKSTSILLGRALEDASEGKPAATGFKWYFAALPDTPASTANPLELDTSCTGAVCNHAFSGKGAYDYWVTVPYPNGYVSEDCGRPCSRSRGQVNVTDVVLAFTAPSSVTKSLSTFTVTSQSEFGGGVQPCAGFEYSLCETGSPGGSCAASSWSPLALTTGSSASIPTPVPASYPAYYWLRIRYSYRTSADCTSPTTVTWQPNAVSGTPEAWPLVVTNVTPSIWLKFGSGNDVCPAGFNCPPFELSHGDSILAYAYVNGVADPSPPTISWSFGDGGTGSGQGAPNTYTNATGVQISRTITLNGYGTPVTATVNVSPQPVVQNPPNVTSATASPSNPTVGQTVSFSCSASPGSNPISSYRWTFGDGGSATTAQATHAYASNGTYTATCTVTDTASRTGSRSTYVSVGGGGGSCTLTGFDWDLYDVASGTQIVPFGGYFDVASGQAVRFQGASSSVPSSGVTWSFGDGGTCSTNPCNYTYNYTGTGSKPYTVSLSYGSCSASHVVYVTGATPPPAQLSFTVVDAVTQAALPKDQFNMLEATSGQRLKLKPVNHSGAVSWNFGDGTTSVETEPEHTFNTAVDAQFRVVLTNGTKTAQQWISVLGSSGAPLTGNFTVRYADNTAINTGAVQPNKAVKFTSLDSADSYLWDFGDGTPLGSGSPVEHTFTRGGTFSVQVTVGRAGVEPVTTASPTVLTILPPPEPLQWVLGGMAYADGNGGTFWQSDLTLVNPSATAAMQVSLAFLDGRVDPDPDGLVWLSITLGPQESKTYANVLNRLFYKDRGSYGGILIRGDDVPVNPVISGRTYNSGSAGGTFGLSVPAVRVSGGVTPQGAAASNVLVGLRQNPAPDGQPASGSRTNLSLANLKDEAARVELRFYNAAGTEIGQPVEVNLAPYRIAQIANVLSAAPPNGAGYTSPLENFTVAVNLLSGSGVFPYATVIDNVSGDSIVVTSVRRPSPTYRLPGVIRAQGKNNTVWRSDVVLYNPGAATRSVNVTYSYVGDSGRRSTETDRFEVGPRQSLAWTDFVDFWLRLPTGDTGNYTDAFLDVTPSASDSSPSDPLLVLAKTYNDQPTGNVGLQVDAFTPESGVSSTSSDRRLVLPGMSSGASYRTNVVLLLASSAPSAATTVTIRVLDSFGREVKRTGETLDSEFRPILQLNDNVLFGDVPGDRSNLTVVVDGVSGSVPVAAYATVIDQVSGDATFVAGQPTP